MTNEEAKSKLCPFLNTNCLGTACMAFHKTHNEVKMQNHGEVSFNAMKIYTEARDRCMEDVEINPNWLILAAEYQCIRLASTDESVTTKRA